MLDGRRRPEERVALSLMLRKMTPPSPAPAVPAAAARAAELRGVWRTRRAAACDNSLQATRSGAAQDLILRRRQADKISPPCAKCACVRRACAPHRPVARAARVRPAAATLGFAAEAGLLDTTTTFILVARHSGLSRTWSARTSYLRAAGADGLIDVVCRHLAAAHLAAASRLAHERADRTIVRPASVAAAARRRRRRRRSGAALLLRPASARRAAAVQRAGGAVAAGAGAPRAADGQAARAAADGAAAGGGGA